MVFPTPSLFSLYNKPSILVSPVPLQIVYLHPKRLIPLEHCIGRETEDKLSFPLIPGSFNISELY